MSDLSIARVLALALWLALECVHVAAIRNEISPTYALSSA
jgi:hypothetical protein